MAKRNPRLAVTIPRVRHTGTVELMEHTSRAFEWIAVAILIVAFLLGVFVAVRGLARGDGAARAYRQTREVFGRGILVALEILVAADLVRTVAVEPTITNVGVLALIVVVRTLLSFALDVEIDGVLPWRKGAGGARQARH